MPAKLATTHVLLDNKLVLYRRENSNIWQCRYKVDTLWQRTTTKQHELKKAKAIANELMITAEIRKRDNLPIITRKFRHVAALAIQTMDQEIAAGRGKAAFTDYKAAITNYFIPFFGSHSITSITHGLLVQFDTWRDAKIVELRKAKYPNSTAIKTTTATHSTILNHNAALKQVFDEGRKRGFLTDSQIPKLENSGKKSVRRPAFELFEIHVMLEMFKNWIDRGRNDASKELRALLKDYVEVLLDTGARPGKELLDLKWTQVKYAMRPEEISTGKYFNEEPSDQQPTEYVKTELNRSCTLDVSGKTGARTIVGMNPTVKALTRIIKRNYGVEGNFTDPFSGINVASNKDYVFRTKAKIKPTSFQNLFESFLDEHSLLVDPKTGKDRVFYSLRHTYATLALTHDKVAIHTLAKQMGTSVVMIEKHYSHLDAVKAIEQLRNYETRRLISAGSVIEQAYMPKLKTAKKKIPTTVKRKAAE